MKKIDVNKKIMMAIIILLGLSLSIMAQPQSRHQQFQKRANGGFGMLNLTDEQKAEIKVIHIKQAKQVQPMKDEILINKAKINALIKNDNPDMKEIVRLVESNGKTLTQIQVKEIESLLAVRTLLNEEQKVIFDAHFGKMHNMPMAQHRPQQMKHRNSR